MKALVCESAVDSVEDLIEKIVVAKVSINITPRIFEEGTQSFISQCELCNITFDFYFEASTLRHLIDGNTYGYAA